MHTLQEIASRTTYPGRCLACGMSDENTLVWAYAIMGRSANSRNRVFVWVNDTLKTAPFDASLVEDPSLVIYTAAERAGNAWVVTNGDQTDTIAQAIALGGTFESALKTRTFEPDAPHNTPRISLLVQDKARYTLSILKRGFSDDCVRAFFYYKGVPSVGHFLSTYAGDGNPLPSFSGEPIAFAMPDELGKSLWQSLNKDNRVSLCVATIDLTTGQTHHTIYNSQEGE